MEDSDDMQYAIHRWARRLSAWLGLTTREHAERRTLPTSDEEEAPRATTAPDTPCSVNFPSIGAYPSSTRAAALGRTPKASVQSDGSDETLVSSSGIRATGNGVNKNPGSQRTRQSVAGGRGGNTPLVLTPGFLAGLFLSMVVCVGILLFSILGGRRGWDSPRIVNLAESTGIDHLYFTFPSIAISMTLTLMWSASEMEIRRMQPLLNLVDDDGPAPPEKTVLLEYTRKMQFLAWWPACQHKDWMVACASLISILTLSFSPLFGALLAVREVWWTGPDILVNSTAKISLNAPENYMDMTAFQAASSFAAADVMYDIGSPPFVSGGYTVAEFTLPKGVSGAVSAEREAILSQASCFAPSGSNLTIDLNSRPEVFHNYVQFGECSYEFAVNSDATYFFGLSTADCGDDVARVSPQYRPVLFWFFVSKPQPAASVTLCKPHATAQLVSVSVNLTTARTDVSTIAPVPDDGAAAADIGSFAHNGLFFNGSILDQTALARLQAIREQLPGAVFEAAKARDPLLQDTFIGRKDAFTALAQDVYTTYLSLIAKSVYFVADETPLAVAHSWFCKRLYVVEQPAIILTIILTVVVLAGGAVHATHRAARRRLPLPPLFGTLAAAGWLTAHADVARALARADSCGELVKRLAGHRYFIDRASGRVLRVPDSPQRDSRSHGPLSPPPSETEKAGGPPSRAGWWQGWKLTARRG
ncbi:hypothetical protein BD413DRAFT_668303 [Trametes elegans]|nr:hypothetical protein BD413DRAFT_668303 [Trametes elegans]